MFTILHTEASLGWGGQEIRIVREAAGVAGRGNRVVIAAPESSMIFGRARDSGIEVFPARFNKRNPLSVTKMAALIDRLGPDILNTHSSADSWVSTLAAKLSRTRPKVIRTKHLSAPISRSFLSRVIYDILPDAVITTGEEIRRMMIERNKFDAGRIISIPTGVDLDQFDPKTVKPASKVGAPCVGMIGVLRSWKGHLYFLEAARLVLKEFPSVRFFIAGEGPQRRNIESMIADLSLSGKVVMLGHREDVPRIIALLDVVVHPSYANEGVPQSVLQALAMGKAVVASDTGAIGEVVIDGKTGFLVRPRSAKEISEKILYLLGHAGVREKFGEAGRTLVERFYSMRRMVDRICELYAGLLESR
jgi:glycosyltransferase involved in cell wall biosynthesis